MFPLMEKAETQLFKQEPTSVSQSDARLTGDQEVTVPFPPCPATFARQESLLR